MGLFDSLPAPSKGGLAPALGKRAADGDPSAADADDKQKRQRAEPAAAAGASAAATHSAAPLLGSARLSAAYSEDKGSRLTMEGA